LRLTKKKIPLERLMEIAAGLARTCRSFFLAGVLWPVIAAMKYIRFQTGPKQTILVVSPRDIAVSTKDAYEWISAN